MNPHEAAVVLSALPPQETAAAARELARELAGPGRAAVVARPGSPQPLFCHVPADRQAAACADVVLLLIGPSRSPSARLLLATAPRVLVLIAGEGADAAEPVVTRAAESPASAPVELVVVATDRQAADEAGARLAARAGDRLADRTTWRHLPAERITDHANEEEPTMPTTRRPVPRSEARLRASEWEESFRRAEKLLQEAQDALKRRLVQSSTTG
ncbi:MAG: hypothetical protein R6V58_02980 [Planctomycetota bacterium]